MRGVNLTDALRSITTSLALLCVLRPDVAGGPTRPQPKASDTNVLMASIRGISVGMTPRRVLLETQKHNWTYSRNATDTLEDIIAKNPSMTSVYLDLNEPSTGDGQFLNTNRIAIHFGWDNASTRQLRVVMIAHSYTIVVDKYATALQTVKAELTALGGFKETLTEEPQFEHRLTYQKVDRNYISYQFTRSPKDSPFMMVNYTISSY